MQKKNTVIFERGSWYYRYKVAGEGGKTKYMKKGGFSTKEEAEYAAFQFERQRVNHEYAERAGMSAGDRRRYAKERQLELSITDDCSDCQTKGFIRRKII